MREMKDKHPINIKPVSELRNYTKLLAEVKPNEPVFLTKNGYGKYAVISIEEYERFKLGLECMEIMRAAEETGYVENDEIMKKYGL
ncbi:type II toxin-antitoxin system prevent-host-death family antitoxin [Enterococcus hulanensis]|uniref:type II toxin-antitoxin system prevent-host-death family antitoxin n=1 Tax=Enterococcus hulanensis TaxID=2559929 RepID=UPI001F5CAC6A|nr:type II toxin-antitoxin system prevent-host-death family antitoxin [Enterococcus hulanensis]